MLQEHVRWKRKIGEDNVSYFFRSIRAKPICSIRFPGEKFDRERVVMKSSKEGRTKGIRREETVEGRMM